MKKDLNALNDYLFEQLERLNDDECLEQEDLKKETFHSIKEQKV